MTLLMPAVSITSSNTPATPTTPIFHFSSAGTITSSPMSTAAATARTIAETAAGRLPFRKPLADRRPDGDADQEAEQHRGKRLG